MRCDRAVTAEISRVVLQESVHLIARNADLMKIMRIVTNDAFLLRARVAFVIAFTVTFVLIFVLAPLISFNF